MDMTISTMPDIGLKEADRDLIEALARSLSPEQARWVGGYLAGAAQARSELLALSSGESTLISGASAGSPQSTVLKVLYASETGNSAALAKVFESKARAAGIDAKAEDLAGYRTRGLKDEGLLVFIASTHGEGDPPESAAAFFEFLAGSRAPSLGGLRFAVLALGDSTYEYFCEAGRRLDRRLAELGGARIVERRDCDVDYDSDAGQWIELVLAELRDHAKAIPARPSWGGTQEAAALALAGVSAAVPRYGKSNPFPAHVTASLRITGRGSSKDTRHLELALDGSGLDYLPGDALGIVPRNDPALVDELLAAFGWSGSEPVAGRNGDMSVAEALAADYEITALTPRFIEQWAMLSDDKRLVELAGKDRSRIARVMADNQIIDLVKAGPVRDVAPPDFLKGLRRLQPRLYSIASSAAFAPDEAHICVAPVRFRLHDRQRRGVASTYLAEAIAPGVNVPVYVQPNDKFRLPADPARPIIMIGAGTGVAPYRAFLQHREVSGSRGRSWLFFGERNFRTDFLYQAEWQDWHRAGTLTRIELAFSRDRQEKVYVQQRLREQASELYRWLEDGAHLYVCGDAERMAHDVHESLLQVAAQQRGGARDDAEEYLRQLQAQGRYQRDVY